MTDDQSLNHALTELAYASWLEVIWQTTCLDKDLQTRFLFMGNLAFTLGRDIERYRVKTYVDPYQKNFT